jgi:hypothetical protein
MRYDVVWTTDHHTLVNAGEKASVCGEKKGSACEEECESESNDPNPNQRSVCVAD